MSVFEALSSPRTPDLEISNFDSLLAAASLQPEPQRILFVFLEASLPKDHDVSQAQRYALGQGGALRPVMCVDKDPEELSSFADLFQESSQMGMAWHLVLVACLCGRGGVMPGSRETDQALKVMMETMQSGGDVSRYMAFDRNGEPVLIY